MADDSTWSAEDWRAYFDERAGIREHDANMKRDMAEALAFGEVVNLYMATNDVSRSTAVYDLRRKMGVNP